MIEPINFILHFGGKTDAMKLVTPSQSAHYFADFADFANSRMRIAILHINSGARFDALGRVVAVVRNVAGAIVNEIVFGQESGAFDHRASGVQKIFSFMLGHIEIDSFKKPAVDEPLAE